MFFKFSSIFNSPIQSLDFFIIMFVNVVLVPKNYITNLESIALSLFISMVSVSMFFTFFYFRIVEAGDLNPLLKGELHVFS